MCFNITKGMITLKKILSLLITIYMVLSLAVTPTFATEPDTTEAPQASSSSTTPPSISCETAIVMDATTGQILYEKNAYQTMYPASITKILTALVAIEQGDLDSTLTMTEDAVWGIEWDSNQIGLQVGEQITLRDALYATMLESANEAAWGIGIHVSGSLSAFCEAMNTRAKELGCTNTNFVNANGLHDDNHYTCAYDMALITKEALTHPEFVEITSTLEYTIPATNMTAEPRYLTHSNRMIQEGTDYYYPYCIGGKTGFTEMAQGTFVAWAEHNGVELICVTMKTNTNANNYTDTIALFNYCFNNYSAIKPLEHHEFTAEDIKDAENYLNDYYGGKNLGTLELATDKDYYFLLENTKEINQVSYRYVMSTDHLNEGVLGYIEVSDEATILAEVPFTYSGYINSEDEAAVQAAIAAGIIEAPKVKKVNKVLIIVITILVIIAVTCFTIFYIKYRQIQKARLAYKRKRDLARKNGRSF